MNTDIVSHNRTYLEGELVNWIDLVEVIKDKVEQCSSNGGWSVILSSQVDLSFSDLGLSHLIGKKRQKKDR